MRLVSKKIYYLFKFGFSFEAIIFYRKFFSRNIDFFCEYGDNPDYV